MRDNWVSSAGPFVKELEAKVAALAGCSHGIATSSGSLALQLMLTGHGIGPGDRVIVPAWTFAATINAVIHSGAEPMLVDIDQYSWTLDPALVAEALTADKERRIKAVIAVDVLGHTADFDRLRQVCPEGRAYLFEDAACTIGAHYRGRPAGGLCDAGTFSFNGNKTVTAGGGGMVVTSSAEKAERMRHLSQQARKGARYQHDAAGFNFRMPNINAALGLAQLARLDEMLARKSQIAKTYDALLANNATLRPMPRPDWGDDSCWLYSAVAKDEASALALIDFLRDRGIESRLFWEDLTQQETYARYPSLMRGVAAGLSGRVLSLPSSSGLTDAELDQVCAALSQWLKRGMAA